MSTNNELKENLEGEMFFKDPTEEYDYFCRRMEHISKYKNDFFQKQAKYSLIQRYIKAIASIEDEYEGKLFIQVYQDCLTELGVDSYMFDKELEDYKKTHPNIRKTKNTPYVSSRSR